MRQAARKEKKISEIKIDELVLLYSTLKTLCEEYSTMTDMYSLSTGDSQFEHMPQEAQSMVSERQRYYMLKQKVKAEVERRVNEYTYE